VEAAHIRIGDPKSTSCTFSSLHDLGEGCACAPVAAASIKASGFSAIMWAIPNEIVNSLRVEGSFRLIGDELGSSRNSSAETARGASNEPSLLKPAFERCYIESGCTPDLIARAIPRHMKEHGLARVILDEPIARN
jgi:hypothetical protein